jgi:hypothetical protein
MKRTWNVYGALLLQLARMPNAIGSWKETWPAGLIGAVACLGLDFKQGPDHAWHAMLFIVLALCTPVLLVCWGNFIKRIVSTTCLPSSALIPYQNLRLMRLAFAIWLLVSLALGLAFGLASGKFGAALVLVAAVMAVVACGFRSPAYMTLALAALVAHPFLERMLAQHAVDWLLSDAGLSTCALLVLVVGVLTFRLLVRRRAEGHSALALLVQRFEAHAERVRIEPWAPSVQTGRWFYDLALSRAISPAGAQPRALLPLVLGPGAHWSVVLHGVAGVLFGFGIVELTHVAFGSVRVHLPDVIRWMRIVLVPATGALHAQTIAASMYATRAEQSLVRLSARMAQNDALNALLARSLLRSFLTGWLLTFVAVLAFGFASGLAQADLVMIALASCTPLLLLGRVMRNYANESERRKFSIDFVELYSLILIVAMLAIVYAFPDAQHIVLMTGPVLGVACLVTAGQYVRARLRAAPGAAVAFPSGRGH